MPRENIHWEVLLQASERARALGTRNIPDLIANNEAAALLGALAHDAPYYYKGGGSDFEIVGGGLHGLSGKDTFDPLRSIADRLLRAPTQAKRAAGTALLLGMISHAIADQHFHPWVFYYTGDYYDPEPRKRSDARRKHRLLEVYLDAWIAAQSGTKFPRKTLREFLERLSSADLDFCNELLGSAVTPASFDSNSKSDRVQAEWKGAFEDIARVQKLCVSLLPGVTFRILALTGVAHWREVEALSAFRRARFGKNLEGVYHYKNPVTGAAIDSSLSDLLEASIAECTQLFVAMDSEIAAKKIPAALSAVRGVSLNYGVFGAGPGEAKFYAPGLPIPGLE